MNNKANTDLHSQPLLSHQNEIKNPYASITGNFAFKIINRENLSKLSFLDRDWARWSEDASR